MTHYHVGFNMPGYMPESDPATCTDAADAIETLRADLEDAEDCAADSVACFFDARGDSVNGDYFRDETRRAVAAVRDARAALKDLEDRESLREALRFGLTYRIGAYAYWLDPCSDDCDTAEEN